MVQLFNDSVRNIRDDVEAYVLLVDTAVFKTVVTRHPGQAGSIPVRLRHVVTLLRTA